MNIPYGKQLISDDDISDVVRVLKSDYLTQGPEVGLFEESFAGQVHAKYALAVSNGTAALHLCAMALGVVEGQRVITTPITFAASANCISYCGGTIEFCDIKEDTLILDLDKLEEMLTSKPKGYYSGVIPVAFGGLMVDLKRLRKIADEYGIWIIEDACHAPGASFVDDEGITHFAGQCDFADCSVFSFHPVKHIACGEGGMVTTSHKEIKEKIELLRTHGITKNPDILSKNDGPWYYEMVELGYNYRLTDMQAVLGNSQLKRLGWSLEERNEIARGYDEFMDGKGWAYQQTPSGYYHAYHLYIIKHAQRDQLFSHLKSKSIHPQIHYIPVHLLPYYKEKGWSKGMLPVAEKYYETCLSLPMYPSLSSGEFSYVLDALDSFSI